MLTTDGPTSNSAMHHLSGFSTAFDVCACCPFSLVGDMLGDIGAPVLQPQQPGSANPVFRLCVSCITGYRMMPSYLYVIYTSYPTVYWYLLQ